MFSNFIVRTLGKGDIILVLRQVQAVLPLYQKSQIFAKIRYRENNVLRLKIVYAVWFYLGLPLNL